MRFLKKISWGPQHRGTNTDFWQEFTNIQKWANDQDGGIRPWSRFFLQGAMNLPVRTVTAAYTLGDLDYVLLVNASTPIAVTLPDASVNLGRTYFIMEVGTGRVTVGTTNSQTINGGTSITIPSQYFHFTFFSDGANWIAF